MAGYGKAIAQTPARYLVKNLPARHLTNVNGTVFFTADDGASGAELWRSDGTEAGTVLVNDIVPGICRARLPIILPTSRRAVLHSPEWRQRPRSVEERWHRFRHDSRTAVPARQPNRQQSDERKRLTVLCGDDGTNVSVNCGRATTLRQRLVKNINPGITSSSPNSLTSVNGAMFFSADDGATGRELWKSDGTEVGTVLVQDIRPGTIDVSPPISASTSPTSIGTLFFSSAGGVCCDLPLWKSDGTLRRNCANPNPHILFLLGLSNAPHASSVTAVSFSQVGFGSVDVEDRYHSWSSDGRLPS